MSDYYDSRDLARFPEIGGNAPDLAKKFFDWYGAVFADGALSAREKSLIALAVAHAVQCPYCIDAYSKDALEKGADLDQMTEAVRREPLPDIGKEQNLAAGVCDARIESHRQDFKTVPSQ